jgi:hypothetical protein
MEIQISGHRAVCVGIFAASFIGFAQLANAGGGGVTGGSTEFTQLANKAELIASYAKHVETALNTLETAMATVENLRQLPVSVVAKLSGAELSKLQTMASMYNRLSSIHQRTMNLANSMSRLKNMSVDMNISPRLMLQAKADAAATYGDIYREQFQEETNNLTQLQKDINDFNNNQEFSKISSTVGGLGYLANQNVAMYNMLGNLNAAVTRANAIALSAHNYERDREVVIESAYSASNKEQKRLLEVIAKDAERMKSSSK